MSVPLLILAVAMTARAGVAQTAALDRLLERAGAYTIGYEERFSTIVSGEQSEQRLFDRSAPVAKRTRKMSSEMMFLWLAREKSWMAVRNVLAVDGRSVGNSQQRLDRLFGSDRLVGVEKLRTMRDEGARFNIGTIRRNFNDAMFPLQFFEPEHQRRFRFTLAGEERVTGSPTSKIAFEEQASPTFIQDGSTDLPARGEIFVASDGAILRTRLRVLDTARHITASISVDYRREPALDMLVPSTMREIYTAGAPYERIESTATYSNFHRFETSVRIVPEP